MADPELMHDSDQQARWNAAAQEVLEAEMADDLAREEDAEWESKTLLRERALDAANSVLGGSSE